jgi:hypothetical protein
MSDVRGRPFEPGNTFGKGRPRGSRNKTSAAARAILLDHATPLVRKALVMALKDGGDPKMMKMCLDLVLSKHGDQPVKLGKLPLGTAADLAAASQIVAQKVTAGKITIDQGLGYAQLFDGHRRALETRDLAARVSLLEQNSSPEVRP